MWKVLTERAVESLRRKIAKYEQELAITASVQQKIELEHRLEEAQASLDRLERRLQDHCNSTGRSPSRNPSNLIPVALVLLFLLGLIVALWISQLDPTKPELPKYADVCNANINDYLSCGEELLVDQDLESKKRIHDTLLKNSQNLEVISKQRDEWGRQSPPDRDPEILIYINNSIARIRQLQRGQSLVKTIAVAVPIGSLESRNLGLEMLRGVAAVQDEAIKADENLQILIADDRNDVGNRGYASYVADELVKRDVLAVIGHFASEVTARVISKYQDQNLVLISPTSTSSDLTSWGTKLDHVFFRTASTTDESAEVLVDHIQSFFRSNPTAQPKAAVFYSGNYDNGYSSSMKKQFEKQFREKMNGQVIFLNENLSFEKFNAKEQLQQLLQRNEEIQILAVFPNGRTDNASFQNAISLVQENSKLPKPFLFLGGNPFYEKEALDKAGEAMLTKFVAVVPWYSEGNDNFNQKIKKIFGGFVSWRTATSYDAALVLREILENKDAKSRLEVQKLMKDSSLRVTGGSVGQVRFKSLNNWLSKFNGGDRDEFRPIIVRVARCSNQSPPFDFTTSYTASCRNQS